MNGTIAPPAPATLRLIAPDAALRDAFLRAAQDHVDHANDPARTPEYVRALADFEAYLAALAQAERREESVAGPVRQWNFWLTDGRDVLGILRFRPRLNPRLVRLGGHLGYDVPPSARRRGYATRMLALGLAKAAEAGLAQAMLTADAGNLPSLRVIEANGGRLDAEYEFEGTLRRRYWAPTPLLAPRPPEERS
jgi:predicted acetyltransferase